MIASGDGNSIRLGAGQGCKTCAKDDRELPCITIEDGYCINEVDRNLMSVTPFIGEY